MDWPQISIGALGALASKWLLDFLKISWNHVLDERKQRATEQRTIRSEQRERDTKEAERIRIELAGEVERSRLKEERELDQRRTRTEAMKQDQAALFLLCTKLRGCNDFISAAEVAGEIHLFFKNRPQYVEASLPIRNFLEKYPVNMAQRAMYEALNDDTVALIAMKNESYDVKIWIR
jgi:uncharacterized membrane protein YqiK